MEHSSRHLRFKLQSLSRRLDDLEEATRNLQKAEDEVLDLQDKIIQAEGSNSSMLADVEALRKRVMKIEGKDEEVKKAEDLCRLIKEKLENEENVTRELRLEIEQLQKRMSELEKLEEAFSKSKSDCTQLCLSLNKEKNMSKKLSSELELFKTRIKELESSESKLDKAEQFLTSELEKIKSLALSFANDRKHFIEREKQHEKTILELKEQLEVKGKITTGEQTRNESNLLERSMDQRGEHNSFRIEDTITSNPLQRVGFDYIKQSEIQTSSKNEKNKHQEDNKIKELNQEIEKLKNQLKHFEGLEQELKLLKEKNRELQENMISEQSKNKQVNDELQALKRQASQFREVENGVLDSDDMPHSRIKNERMKNKVVSTEPPLSKYTSRDISPQHMRNERFRNSETTYKRQLSNSRKASRSALADATTGNLRKPEDKALYKDLSSTQNEFKKSKEQPSVLSRYPPAIQDQLPQKSWKNSTGKQTDRSIKLFGEDYSSKAYSKREVSLENEDIKGRSEDSSENGATTNLHEEIPAENCTLSSALTLEPANPSLDVTNDLECNSKLESKRKSWVNLEDVRPTGRDRLSKYSRSSSRDDHITNTFEQTSTFCISSKDEGEPQKNQTSNTQRSYNSREMRSRPSKPLIPEKPHILDSSNYRESERRVRLTGLHTKPQSGPQEENHSLFLQRDVGTDPLRKTSSDGMASTETNSYTATRTRSCSPRESLQCMMFTKPLIIEKDMKESMSDYRARSSSEINKSQVNTTPNKVTSSITIYPNETVPTRANVEEATKERHTSTSNIRLSANDQPVLKNNIMVPIEFSLTKEDGVLKVGNTDKTFDQKEMTKVTDQSLVKEQTKGIDNELLTSTWKSIDMLETNHLDSKRGTRSSWRKGLYGSTEELDRIDRDLAEGKSRRKSCFDEDKTVRLRNYELSSRNKSSSVGSWKTTPEFISKRSQSSLTAKEIVSRKNTSNDSGYTSSSRSSLDVDDSFSSRRKYTSDRLGRIDSTGWRQTQTQSQRQKSMVEERIRQLEH